MKRRPVSSLNFLEKWYRLMNTALATVSSDRFWSEKFSLM